MARVAALATLCASACFAKPPFSGNNDNGDGGTNDRDARQLDAPGTGIDAMIDAPACASIYRDDFSQTTGLTDPCKPWGFPEGTPGIVSRDMGGLKFQGTAIGSWSSGCISDEFDVSRGVTIRLVNAQVDSMTAQRFALIPMGMAGTGIIITNTGTGTKVILMRHDSVMTANPPSYNPQTMKWLELEIVGMTIVASYSANGMDWTPLGTDNYFQSIPTLGRVEITGGRNGGGPEYVLWDDFNVLTCPP